MKVKDIIKTCLIKLNIKDFSLDARLTDAQNDTLNNLIGCINIAFREIATEHCPLVYSEEMLSDGQIRICELTHKIIYPISFEAGGQKQKLKVSGNKIATDYIGTGLFSYTYLPDVLTLDSNIDLIGVTEKIIVSATLAEYCFRNRLYELAKSYDNEFRSTLMVMKMKGKEITLKQRRFF